MAGLGTSSKLPPELLEMVGAFSAISKDVKREIREIEKDARKAAKSGKELDPSQRGRLTDLYQKQTQLLEQKKSAKRSMSRADGGTSPSFGNMKSQVMQAGTNPTGVLGHLGYAALARYGPKSTMDFMLWAHKTGKFKTTAIVAGSIRYGIKKTEQFAAIQLAKYAATKGTTVAALGTGAMAAVGVGTGVGAGVAVAGMAISQYNKSRINKARGIRQVQGSFQKQFSPFAGRGSKYSLETMTTILDQVGGGESKRLKADIGNNIWEMGWRSSSAIKADIKWKEHIMKRTAFIHQYGTQSLGNIENSRWFNKEVRKAKYGISSFGSMGGTFSDTSQFGLDKGIGGNLNAFGSHALAVGTVLGNLIQIPAKAVYYGFRNAISLLKHGRDIERNALEDLENKVMDSRKVEDNIRRWRNENVPNIRETIMEQDIYFQAVAVQEYDTGMQWNSF